jgi:HlyD family secretion protein
VSAAAAQTIDSLFGPLPVTETAGRAWVLINNQLKPVRLRLGISDGTYTEIISGELEEGAEVVTGVTLAAQSAASTPGRSPLMGPSRGPGGGPPPSGGAARQPGR